MNFTTRLEKYIAAMRLLKNGISITQALIDSPDTEAALKAEAVANLPRLHKALFDLPQAFKDSNAYMKAVK